MAHIWKKGALTTNPYYETAFQSAGITRDIITRAEIDQRIGERRQAVAAAPGYYRLGARALTLADITIARQILLDPTRRILEELLEHQPEQLEASELERLRDRLTLPIGVRASPRHLAFLLRAAQELAREFLLEQQPAEPPPYPVDLAIIPPFGFALEHA